MSVPRLMTTRDVAEYLSVSVNTVKRMVERGDLPKPIRFGGVVRWDRARLDATIDRRSAKAGYDDPDEALANLGEDYGKRRKAAAR